MHISNAVHVGTPFSFSCGDFLFLYSSLKSCSDSPFPFFFYFLYNSFKELIGPIQTSGLLIWIFSMPLAACIIPGSVILPRSKRICSQMNCTSSMEKNQFHCNNFCSNYLLLNFFFSYIGTRPHTLARMQLQFTQSISLTS